MMTAASGMNNIAFACALQLSDPTNCVDLLLSTDRAPEAALFARTFAPSQTSKAVKSWRKTLEQQKKIKIAGGLADPEEHVEEFGGAESWAEALEREKRGPEIEEEPEQEQYEQEQEQYEQQQQQQYEYEPRQDEGVNGVQGGVEGLHLGAEQSEEEYVPQQAQEGLSEFAPFSSRLLELS